MRQQDLVQDFLLQHGLDHAPETHALDLVAEVGEVAKAMLLASDYGQNELAAGSDLAEELGDVFFSLCGLSVALGVDLERALSDAPSKYEARLATRGHAGSGRP